MGLTLEADVPTSGAPVELRAWVAHVDGYYEKPAWDAAPMNVDGLQPWNGGELRIAAPHDVWPHVTAWDGESGASGGWFAGGAAAVGVVDGRLQVTVTGEDPQLVSPALAVRAGRDDTLMLNLNNGLGSPSARLYWSVDEAGFAGARAAEVALPVAAGWAELVVPLGELPGWSGAVDRLRLDPAASRHGVWLLESVVLDAASAEDTGGGPPRAEVIPGATGCACDAAGSGAGSAGALLALARARPAPRGAQSTRFITPPKVTSDWILSTWPQGAVTDSPDQVTSIWACT